MNHRDCFIGRGRSEGKKDEDSKNNIANPQRPGWKRSAKQQKRLKCEYISWLSAPTCIFTH